MECKKASPSKGLIRADFNLDAIAAVYRQHANAISVLTDEKYFHIHICDVGTGIANQENLFVPFYSTKPQGSGIGLTLCKQILFNHGGLLTLANRTTASGAEAIISLPKD